MAEILAPAGNMDMLKAAVVNGADAVYLGLSKFSARAKAANFNEDELNEAINYAHLFGVKVYVAINTVIKNDEVSDALSAAVNAIDSKADALILQDLGLASLIRQKCPQAVLHASTQMGIHNVEGALVAKKLGFSRIILSRETLLEDIIKIKKCVDIEIECFVQGALCIAFSGNCYFSSFASGYSGNRGKCMQLCRKRYAADLDGKTVEGYLLSAKDLMLGRRMNELVNAGVDCFKIEGRLRRPEYVAEAVRVYKKALNSSFDESDLSALKKVFNRGDYTEAHLFVGTNKVLDINICGHKGEYFCKVLKLNGNKAVLSKPLNKGDGIKFLRRGKEVGSASILHAGSETGFEGEVRAGDDVYITTDTAFNNDVMSRTKKLPVSVVCDFENSVLSVKSNDVEVECKIENAQSAINSPITQAEVVDNFNKSNYFTVANAKVIGGPTFIIKSEFNKLRRNAYDSLISKIISDYNKNMPIFSGNFQSMPDIINQNTSLFDNKTIYQVESVEQITSDMQIISVNPREYSVEFLSKFSDFYDRALLNLPCIARGKDIDILKEIIKNCNFKGYIVNNLYGLELAKGKPIILGYGLNIVNDLIDVPKIYSFESDCILKDGYVYAQGNVPLMNFSHCEKKELLNGCENCRGYDITLSYENRDFYLRRYKIYYCYAQLLNCANLDISDRKIEKSIVDYSFKRAQSVTKGNYGRGLK